MPQRPSIQTGCFLLREQPAGPLPAALVVLAERVDVAVAEVADEQRAGGLAEARGGRPGEAPRSVQLAASVATRWSSTPSVEYSSTIPSPGPSFSSLLPFVCLRVRDEDVAAEVLDPERRIPLRQLRIAERARLLHELPVAADDVDAAVVEVGRVEPVACGREALVDGAPLRAVEARHGRARARRPALDRAGLGGEDELRGHHRRAVRDQELRAAVEDRAGRRARDLDDERPVRRRRERRPGCVVERRGVGAVVGDPPGRRRTLRHAPGVDEVRIGDRRDARLIRDERRHRVRAAAAVLARAGGSAGGREGNRECGPRERDPSGALHWASLVEERAGPRTLFLRAPGESRIAAVHGGETPPWGRQNGARATISWVCAPRSSPSSFPSRSSLRFLQRRRPRRARRFGRGAALVGPRPRPERSPPAPGRPGRGPRGRVRSARRGARPAGARHARPTESEPLSVAIPSHAITLQGSALFHTGDRQRVHAAVEGKLDDTLRGTVLLMTCERRDEHSQDWHLALRPHRRRDRGRDAARAGAAAAPHAHPAAARALRCPTATSPLRSNRRSSTSSTTSASPRAATRSPPAYALTPAMIAWLCERAPEALVVETGGASVRLATAAMLSSDEELDAFAPTPAGSRTHSSTPRPRQAQAAA